MLGNIKFFLKILFNYNLPGKYSKIKKSDTFIISYPRSGNTWTRFLIANYIYESVDFHNINKLVPDIHITSKNELDNIASPRIIKSHFTFDPNVHKFIYIKRNIIDVATSYFYWFKKYRPNKFKNFDEYFKCFCSGDLVYGSWEKHIEYWITNNNADFLIIDYDDLYYHTEITLKKIIVFLNIKIDEKKITQSVVKSSFKQMANLEKKNKDSAFFKNSNQNIRFIRSGTNHINNTLLDKNQIKLLNKIQKRLNKKIN